MLPDSSYTSSKRSFRRVDKSTLVTLDMDLIVQEFLTCFILVVLFTCSMYVIVVHICGYGTLHRALQMYRLKNGNSKSFEILKTLMDHGASIILHNNMNNEPFRYLLSRADKKTLAMLLRYDYHPLARCREFNRTPLSYIILNKNHHALDLIKRDGQFDLNARDWEGNTPLSDAILVNGVNKVKYLLEHGANPNTLDIYGWSPLRSAIHLSYSGNNREIKIIQLLLQHGAEAQELRFDLRCNFNLLKPVLAHLAMIESQGQTITQFTRSQIHTKDVYNDYYELCQRQLEQLKKTTFYESVTLYEILVGNLHRISRYAANLEFRLKFDKIVKNIHDTIVSYYYSTIRIRAGKAIQMATERFRSADKVCEITGFHIVNHHNIVFKIVDYLDS